MSRTLLKALPVVALLGAGLVSMGPRVTGQATGLPSTKNGEWPMYTADLNGSKYSPLDQINAGNFSKLEVAWRLKTDNFGTRPEYKLEATPIMVKGVLYMTAGTRRSVIAVDAKSGEIMWSHSYREGTRAAIAPRQLSGRGASYWTDGKGDERIIYVTTGYRMIALNAKNGQMISSFGTNGVVDLKEGAFFGNRQPIDKETGEIGLHSTPTITKDTIIVGSSFKEGMTVLTHNNTKGLVRAFDVRTGKMIWTFNTIPRPGEFGNDTWENDSWSVNGNTGVWTQISVDEEAGLAYLPVETPTSDFYGGHRHGNNLFAESIVAVDVKTGQRKWHYQLIHHGIWDHDNSSASLLVDATVNGQPRKLLAQPTKQGWLYVFDRLTGQPIWPIEEKPMPASDVPGEKASPTQPIPSRPAPYSRTHIAMDDLIDFTPALRAEALEKLKKYRWEQSPYVPLIMGNVNGRLGTVNIGNTGGWGGAKAYSSYEAAIADPAVDAVVVAVPPKYHLELTLAALAAGKHVLVEKPAFPTLADYATVREARDRAGRVVLVGENDHYKPLCVTLRRLLADDAIGEMVFAQFSTVALRLKSADDWRNDEAMAGGDAFFEEGIHWLHIAGSLGPRITAIQGYRPSVSRTGPDRRVKSMMVAFRYDNDAVGTIYYSREIPSVFQGLRMSKLMGRTGSITFESNGLFVFAHGAAGLRASIPGLLYDIRGYKAMYRDFASSIAQGRAPEMSLERALEDHALMERIYASVG